MLMRFAVIFFESRDDCAHFFFSPSWGWGTKMTSLVAYESVTTGIIGSHEYDIRRRRLEFVEKNIWGKVKRKWRNFQVGRNVLYTKGKRFTREERVVVLLAGEWKKPFRVPCNNCKHRRACNWSGRTKEDRKEKVAWKNCWRLLISNTSVSPPFHPSSLFFPRCWVDSNAGEYKYHLLFTRDFQRAKEGASFPSGSLIQFFFLLYFTLLTVNGKRSCFRKQRYFISNKSRVGSWNSYNEITRRIVWYKDFGISEFSIVRFIIDR